MQDAVEQCGNREQKADNRSRGANVKQRAIRAHGRTDHDKSAKRAGQVGEGNKERITGVKMMVSASKEMSQFMGEQDPQQGGRKREAREQAGGIFVEKREATQKRT